MPDSQQSALTWGLRQKFLLLLLAVLAMSPAWAEKPTAPNSINGVVTVNADKTIELILNTPELIVIDARHPEEFHKGHIEDAIQLVDTAVNKKSLAQIVKTKTTPLLFYCNGPRCLRSSRAAKKALKYGYTNIYWFRGGWSEWMAKELPVIQ